MHSKVKEGIDVWRANERDVPHESYVIPKPRNVVAMNKRCEVVSSWDLQKKQTLEEKEIT